MPSSALTTTTQIYTLSLHDALPISMSQTQGEKGIDVALAVDALQVGLDGKIDIAVLVTGDGDFVPLVRALNKRGVRVLDVYFEFQTDRKSTRLNSSHLGISYAVFCFDHDDPDLHSFPTRRSSDLHVSDAG